MNVRSEEHTSELQSPCNLVCRLLLEKKNKAGFSRGASVLFTLLARLAGAGGVGARPTPARGISIVRVHPEVLKTTRRIFFFNDTATTEIYTLSLHDALPIWKITPRTAGIILVHMSGAPGDAKAI